MASHQAVEPTYSIILGNRNNGLEKKSHGKSKWVIKQNRNQLEKTKATGGIFGNHNTER